MIELPENVQYVDASPKSWDSSKNFLELDYNIAR
jgi:hypothetical protein